MAAMHKKNTSTTNLENSNDQQIEIQFVHHCSATSEAFFTYAREKLNKIMRHCRINRMQLMCDIERGRYHIKAVIHLPRQHIGVLRVTSHDMYECLDLIVPKIENYSHRFTKKMNGFTRKKFGDVDTGSSY